MTATDQRLLTTDEVLACLREVAPEPWIVEECEQFEKLPVGDYMGDWDSIVLPPSKELSSFFHWIQDRYGFEASHDEWRPLTNRRATVAHLAAFISQRAPAERITTASVLGRPCRKAAIFRMIERCSRRLAGSDIRFTPSTELDAVLSRSVQRRLAGRLTFFFPRLAWADSGLLAPHPETRLVKPCLTIAMVGTIVFMAALVMIKGRFEWSAFIGCSLIIMNGLMLLVGVVAFVMQQYLGFWKDHRFAAGIRTFRDLVNVLDDERVTRFVDA